MLQSDFSSYLSHSALLINTIAIITSSGRFSIHYTSFISVPHTLHLNYYHMQSQYKSVIQFVQQYKNLYAKFEASLRRNEGLIRNSVLFKSWKFPIVLVHVVCLHLTAARVPKHYIIYIIYLFIYLFTLHYHGKLQLALYIYIYLSFRQNGGAQVL